MIDMDKHAAGIAYGKDILAVFAGESYPPSGYPNTDEGVLQWLLEDMDIDKLHNDFLALDVQLTLNRWIVDGEPASEIRAQIVTLLADVFGFDC